MEILPMNKQRLHVIPLGVSEPPHHTTLDCWCQPLDTDSGTLAIHHAKDGREKWERQGIIDHDRPWCVAYENLTDLHGSPTPSE